MRRRRAAYNAHGTSYVRALYDTSQVTTISRMDLSKVKNAASSGEGGSESFDRANHLTHVRQAWQIAQRFTCPNRKGHAALSIVPWER